VNTARLGNLWHDAKGDTHLMAAALGEELSSSHFATKADLNELRLATKADLNEMKADLYKAMGIALIAQGAAIVSLIKLSP
jgi:hypothetical protein